MNPIFFLNSYLKIVQTQFKSYTCPYLVAIHGFKTLLLTKVIQFLDKITKTMQSLSQRAVDARNALVKDGKDELANIIIEIQKNEEELLIVR